MIRFEDIYRRSPDPWHVYTDWYEQRKRSTLLCALSRQRYHRALELGCGNGALTRALAPRCDAIVAADVSPTAASLCEQGLRQDGSRNARVCVVRLPGDWPGDDGGPYDLIVISELAYYMAAPDLRLLFQRCHASLAPAGEWVMCHFVKDFDERTQATDEIHAAVDRLSGLVKVVDHRDELFQMDVWRKQATGPAG